jgi:hypothetical protein
MTDPKMTRFRYMSMDEQETKIDKLAQEALRSREEIRAAEATKVHNRGLLLAPKAEAREFLLME